MSWQDQGRQEHGWFGHGHGFAIRGHDPDVEGAELRARAKAAFSFALEELRGIAGAASIPYREARETLGELVPRWAGDATSPPNDFRQRWFGPDADPLEAWGMQRVALAVRTADTYSELRQAGAELSAAMKAVGLPAVRGFLRAAQARASLDDAADAAPIQRIADHPEEDGEGGDQADKRLLPKSPVALPRAKGIDDPQGGGISPPRIGGAAMFRGDGARGGAGATPPVQQIPPEQLRFSQRTAGGNGRADKQRAYVDAHGTIMSPVDAVRTPDGLVTIDNTRIAVAREKGLSEVPVRVWDPSDPLPPDMAKRFDGPQTWGEALQKRLLGQLPSPLPATGTTEIPSLPLAPRTNR